MFDFVTFTIICYQPVIELYAEYPVRSCNVDDLVVIEVYVPPPERTILIILARIVIH